MLKKDQIESELQRMKEEIMRELAQRNERVQDEPSVSSLSSKLEHMAKDREETIRILRELAEQVNRLQKVVEENNDMKVQTILPTWGPQTEEPMSEIDVKIIRFIQASKEEMVYADQLKEFMNYKGRNAACARLGALCRKGWLRRYQLGHKVYYKVDAGKATNALIISPPQ